MEESVQELRSSDLKETIKQAHVEQNKHLIFKLNEERYALQLSMIKEVIAITTASRIPNVAGHFYGLINLRGAIITVIDLRKKLGIPAKEFEEKKTSIMIVEVESYTLGFIVDEIIQVLNIDESIVERDGGDLKLSREYISGIARISGDEKGLVILLNEQNVVGIEELKRLDQMNE